MQVVAVHIGADEAPENMGQSGCDDARIDAVGFAVLAQYESAALEAEMAWRLVHLRDGRVEMSTEVVYGSPGQKNLNFPLRDN